MTDNSMQISSAKPGQAAAKPSAKTGDWLSQVFNHSPDMIVLLDRAGVIHQANQAFQTFCAPGAAVTGRKITEFIPRERQPQWTGNLDKLRSGEWTSVEDSLLNSQGRAIPFQIALIAHSIYQGTPVAIFHLRDVSVYQTVERALVASQGQWERSFDAIQDYMCLLDRSGRILRANQAMNRQFQPLYGDLVGRDYRTLFNSVPRAEESPRLPDAVQAAPFVVPVIELPRLKGCFSVSSFPLKDQDEALTGAVLIIRDITAEHAAQEALKKAEVVQHQTCKMEALGRLAGSVAHDFNNMLTSVLGYGALLLKSAKPDDPHRKEFEEIIQAAERAAMLTRQLLDFSRNQPVETTVVDLNAVIRKMENLLRHTLGEKIKLTTQLDPALRNTRADPARLEQVIINIIMNARDAMLNGGELVIETHRRNLDQFFCAAHAALTPGDYCLMEISDTGCGMTPEVRERLFEPFFTTKTKGKGTGLGLSTAYGIVKQFGGDIAVYSEVGRGTTFKLYFPESAEAAAERAQTKPEGILLRGHETILVVDDDANIVSIISRILTGLGYHVITATSPRQALALSDGYAQAIDLVLSDVIMPEFNGPELVRRLHQKRPTLKAMYMSGYASQAARQLEVLSADIVFLPKPFNPETLTKHIRKALDSPVK
ncbi:MAG: PAS domain-containing protein [Lentisphaerae bacterium]|nr:PAS domain-containing protein [Lentisphaerota bacterium]